MSRYVDPIWEHMAALCVDRYGLTAEADYETIYATVRQFRAEVAPKYLREVMPEHTMRLLVARKLGVGRLTE